MRAGELARFKVTQLESLLDTCVVLVYSSTEDEFNLPAVTYTPGAPLSCGYDPSSSREVQDSGQVVITDGLIRLPAGTAITHLDRIQLTHRAGQALATPITFDVVGQVAPGPSGLVVEVEEVAGG